ncbi:MAG: DEAD/DEAH box helicase [Candidatus Lokiarchaeota archaeon]|nr:DEAD/DEAH box helicase [Candidatus Lokiarchaeota archaeon]
MYLKNKIETLAFFPYKKNKVKVLAISNEEFLDDIVIRVELIKKKKDKYRPYKIWYKQRGRQNFIEYKDFFKLLRSLKSIIIPRMFKNDLRKITRMLEDYQIDYKIAEICRYCKNKNKLTLIDVENSYLYYDELICKSCGVSEIQNELKFINFKPTRQFMDNIKKLLEKLRNVNKIITIFKPGFIAAKKDEFTLYDTLEPDKKKKPITQFEVSDLNLPVKFNKILSDLGINFLPIQNLAISKGLLDGEDLLIVAPTSTGKTLCGELAGIPKALNNGKMIYLSPLVSLSNTKYEEFKSKYGDILNVSIRVGMSRIDTKGEDFYIEDSHLKDTDIIVASYEAFDFIIRKGEYNNIKEVKTIIVDEIQTLGDLERGVELDGLISRLKIIYPNAQIIGLSATISNADEIGEKLGLEPVIYKYRPVPVERHLILCKTPSEKMTNLKVLIQREKSFGATIVFTNSRYKTYKISKYLRSQGLNLPDYHAGLSYYRKKRIEEAIENKQIDGVVSTFALGAGVDLPVSQVVFHSLRMGRDYLDNNMFLQMSGRAGRYKRHSRGKVVLLAELGNKFFGSNKTEDRIALSLLEGTEEDICTQYYPEEIETQVLATLSSGLNLKLTKKFYDQMLGAEEEFNYLLKELYKKDMLELVENKYKVSELGEATARSFFKPDQALEIRKKLDKKRDLLEIVIEIEYFNNIYLDNRIKEDLSRILKRNISSLFFSGFVFDIFSTLENIRGTIPNKIIDLIKVWQENFSCEHEKEEYCECGLLKTNVEIIELRLSGLTPREVSDYFKNEYKLVIYPGDIFKMLDNAIHRLRGVKRIARVLELDDYLQEIEKYINNIENPE